MGAYFKVSEMNNIKFQSLVIFSFKIRIKPNIMKNLNINNIFIVLLFAY